LTMLRWRSVMVVAMVSLIAITYLNRSLHVKNNIVSILSLLDSSYRPTLSLDPAYISHPQQATSPVTVAALSLDNSSILIYHRLCLNSYSQVIGDIYSNAWLCCATCKASFIILDVPNIETCNGRTASHINLNEMVSDMLLLYNHICGQASRFSFDVISKSREDIYGRRPFYADSDENLQLLHIDLNTMSNEVIDLFVEIDVILIQGRKRFKYVGATLVESHEPIGLPLAPSSGSLDRCIPFINTRVYVPDCIPKIQGSIFPLLLTGLGGSGTHAIANLLRALRIDVSHESIGSFGAVGWQYAVNDVVIGAPYPHKAALNRLKHTSRPRQSLWFPRFFDVVHVVRCPIRQISSLTSHLDSSFEFILRAMRIDLKSTRHLYLQQRTDMVTIYFIVHY
jgi:hypothetical protein